MNRPTDRQIAAWYPRLFRTALRLTGQVHDAAEVTQETFCKALAHWDQFNGNCGPMTWLHRILVNCTTDWARLKAVRKADRLDEWAAVPAEAESAEEQLDREARLAALRQAIQELPEKIRRPFVAVVLDGHHYSDVAEMLGMPLGTVANYVHQARRLLRKTMGESLPEV